MVKSKFQVEIDLYADNRVESNLWENGSHQTVYVWNDPGRSPVMHILQDMWLLFPIAKKYVHSH